MLTAGDVWDFAGEALVTVFLVKYSILNRDSKIGNFRRRHPEFESGFAVAEAAQLE